MTTSSLSITNFKISPISNYLLVVLLLSISMRVLIALMQTLEVKCSKTEKENGEADQINFFRVWISFFWGRNPISKHHDLLYNFFIGTIELLIYPVLLATNNLEIIGAWIGLKALAQWTRWTDNRLIYNRFLIGNLLIVLLSFLFLKHFIF